jgi:hypothetical protein
MFILLNAAHKSKKVGTSTGVITLERGQYISGRNDLARKLKSTAQSVRTSLHRLTELEILTIESTNRYSIYTIVNYSIYQDINQQDNQQPNQQPTSSQPAVNQQSTTKQTLKHLNIEEKVKYIPPIPAELLSDFLQVRKAKRAGALTKTAFYGIEKEATKAGLTAEQAIQICCQRGWAGFEASWLNGKDGIRLNKQEALEKSNRDIANNWTPPEQDFNHAI